MQRSAFLVGAAALLGTAACERVQAPSVEACAEILARRIPESRVVEAVATEGAQVTLDYELGRWWDDPEHGSLVCSFEELANGGVRLRDATLDGVAFTDNERTVINVDLLLADMRRSTHEAADRHD